MKFSELLKILLGIGNDFEVSKVETNESKKQIDIYLKYLPKCYKLDGVDFPIYDHAPKKKMAKLELV
jgi:hypothetical protein